MSNTKWGRRTRSDNRPYPKGTVPISGGNYALVEAPTSRRPSVLSIMESGWVEAEEILEYDNVGDLKTNILLGKIPTFENRVILVGDDYYKFYAEGWYDDCLESRDMGKTTPSKIKRHSLVLMKEETGLKPDVHGFIPDAVGTEYGTSFIMERI